MSGSDKQSLRERIWDQLEQSGESLFPGAPGRIPNFRGRDEAAERLCSDPHFERAEQIKINPDSPQKPVRRIALERGKTLYMAVPKLREERCFRELDPGRIDADPSDAATIKGASRHGVPVHPSEMPPIDLIVTGSVGVDPEGRRLGKGGGYSDLEFALLLETDRVDADVPIWSTVHPIQELAIGTIPREDHDLTLTGYALPDRTVRVETPLPRPGGIVFSLLSEEQLESIPILQQLR